MQNTKDIINYDYTTIYVKKNMSDDIKKSYSLCGWKIEEEKENNRYEDLLDITFSRKHKIKNKDDLQILQVFIEDKYNKLGKLERNKHSSSLITTLCLEVFGVFFLLSGLMMLLDIWHFDITWLSIASIVIGGIMLTLGLILLPFILKIEKVSYNTNKQNLKNEIQQIEKRVISLNGDAYEEV